MTQAVLKRKPDRNWRVVSSVINNSMIKIFHWVLLLAILTILFLSLPYIFVAYPNDIDYYEYRHGRG